MNPEDSGTVRIALAQIRVEPGASEANVARAVEAVGAAARSGAALVLLPEALDTGWAHPEARQLAGPVPGGSACAALVGAAERHGIWVAAGLSERAGDRVYNAAVLIDPASGVVSHHRKLHELDHARRVYSAGDRLGVVETPWGRVGLMICADGFAPGESISRTLGLMGAEWILSPCAWAVPPDRDLVREPYGALWRGCYGPVAREFGLTIAGCSNVGPVVPGAWAGWRCIGSSLVVGPDGAVLAEGPCGDSAEALIPVGIPRVRARAE